MSMIQKSAYLENDIVKHGQHVTHVIHGENRIE